MKFLAKLVHLAETVQQIPAWGVLLLIGFSATASAQSPSLDFTAERNFVYQNGVTGLLPFAVIIANPTAAPLTQVQFVISMPVGIRLGNVDKECSEAAQDTTRTLGCTIANVPAYANKIIDFYIDGPNSNILTPSFVLSLNASGISIVTPGAYEASLADGDTRIRGANLTVYRVRDLNLDFNQNGVSDIDEAILKVPAGLDAEQLLARKAAVDILFLYTPAAEQYLGDKLPERMAEILTATNQDFRNNEVAIKLHKVGDARVAFANTNTTLASILSAMQTLSDPAFTGLGQMVIGSGADLVVLLHALAPGADTYCGFASLNGVGRQGDFQAQHDRGKLLSVLNTGPDCLGIQDLAPLFASNMGIVPSRLDYPDGGTFSYSAGYGVRDVFATQSTRLGTAGLFGQAQILERFSNPASLCLSLTCGVDRGDLINGADAVYSLNKTRHVVSAINDSPFSVAADSIGDRQTVSGSQDYDLEVVHWATDVAALQNEFTRMNVSITNRAGITLHDLDVSLLHLANGQLNNEIQVYENTAPACRILASDLGSAPTVVGDAVQQAGTLSCFLSRINPDETVQFSYRILVDNTPPTLAGDAYYHELVAINHVLQPESTACIPVFTNFILASYTYSSSVCDAVQLLIPGVAPGVPLDLNALPTVTGSRLSLPFVRLYDGSLYRAELQVTLTGGVQLQLVSYTELDASLTPTVEATVDMAGVLNIASLSLNPGTYSVQATYVPDSDPVRFNALITTLIGP